MKQLCSHGYTPCMEQLCSHGYTPCMNQFCSHGYTPCIKQPSGTTDHPSQQFSIHESYVCCLLQKCLIFICVSSISRFNVTKNISDDIHLKGNKRLPVAIQKIYFLFCMKTKFSFHCFSGY